MKQIFMFLFCIVVVVVGLFGQTRIDSGQIRRVNLPKIVTPTQEIIFGTGTGAKSDPKIKVDSTLNSIEVRGTGTKVSKTSMQPGYVEMRGDTTADNNVFLKILDGRSSPYTYAPFGLSVEYGNPSQTPYKNYVWTIGPNAAANTGVAFDATKPMASKNWETSWLESSVPTFEIHEHFKHPDSAAIRLNSYTIRYPVQAISGNRNIYVDKYEAVDNFSVKHWKTGNVYFSTAYNRATNIGAHAFYVNGSQYFQISGAEDATNSYVNMNFESTTGKIKTISFNNFALWQFNSLGDNFVSSTRTMSVQNITSTLLTTGKIFLESGRTKGIWHDANVRMLHTSTDYQGIYLGAYAGHNISSGATNTFVGYYTGAFTGSGSRNVYIGHSAGSNNGSTNGSIKIGNAAGQYAENTGVNTKSVMIGDSAAHNWGGGISLANKLVIQSTPSTIALISGDFSTKRLGIGIANAAPTSTLHVAASTTSQSSIRVPTGTAPSSPNEGDLWQVSNDLHFYTNSTDAILARVLKGSATLDFPNTSSGSSADLTITVTGAADGDIVSLGVPNASQTATGSFSGWVSATNTVTIRYRIAALTGSENPDPGTFKVTVTK